MQGAPSRNEERGELNDVGALSRNEERGELNDVVDKVSAIKYLQWNNEPE